MRVEEIDGRRASDETLLAIHAIEQACLPELIPGEPGRSAEESIAYYRHPPATHERLRWLVDDVATAGVFIHSPTAVFLELLVVPDRRREGIGTALLETALAGLREAGGEVLHGQHATPAGAAFARQAGAVDGQRDVRSLLRLGSTDLSEPVLAPGWQLFTWRTRVPDANIDAYVRARAAMDDAPTPDGVVFPSETVERVRAMENSLIERGRELRITAALDGEGTVGAFTDLRHTQGSAVAYTDDTGTVAEARGLGLATAVKLESLRALRFDQPEIEVVMTMNAEENGAMRHINRRIGFVEVATLTTTTITL